MHQAVTTVMGEVEMKMVAVKTVVVRAEHGREVFAGAVVNHAKEGLLAR
jgi:hypothetical protein